MYQMLKNSYKHTRLPNYTLMYINFLFFEIYICIYIDILLNKTKSTNIALTELVHLTFGVAYLVDLKHWTKDHQTMSSFSILTLVFHGLYIHYLHHH